MAHSGVTADSTLWTADTHCVTADGRIVCIDADVAEPIGGRGPTADTTLWTADSTVLTADGGAVAGATDSLDAVAIAGGAVIPADEIEPATALDVLDAAVGGNVFFADVVEAANALDQHDAAVVGETVAAPGGAFYPQRRPFPVVGYGYGILPQLEGEAHGVVGAVGKSAARLIVHAAAAGACGQAGHAAVVLKALSVTGKGAIGARGSGEGVIVKCSGTATGHHDDDEAAVLAILLAA